MTGEGIVIRTSGETATVKIKRSSACGHDCGECNLCKNPDIEVEILNHIGAKAGNRVKIATDTAKVLRDTFFLYMLPVLGALVLYVILSAFGLSSAICIVLEVIWFLLWYLFIRYYSRHSVTMSCAVEILK